MASKFDAVWAIDLGNSSLKALHLSAESGVVEVIGFDNIQHSKILTGAGVTEEEKDELIALSLRRFVKQNDLGRDDIVISVPSQSSFARFVNLPPVEAKRIPEIVKFEAAQQIPFDINEVQWDWQLMTEGDSPENKVGIFAIKNDVVNSALEYFGAEDVTVGYVQMVPMALYNYVLYDRPDLFSLENQAIVALDIGAENTDLVVCTKSTVWQRCIPMGGNAFTRAIADAFKLNFERAEKLKRTAPMSKYARQILQAMRPVFMDLASEIQRSLGFYTSSNPNTKLLKVIAFGGGTKMRGLLKYLRQTLQMPIERPDSFKKLAIGPGVSAAKFHENVSDFGIIYGLALQGLGLAKIESNLLPRSIARSMVWGGKAKYFTAAACGLLLVSVLSFGRTLFDKASYGKHEKDRSATMRIIIACNQAGEKLKAEKIKGAGSKAIIQKAFESFKHRDVIPLLHQIIISALPNEENNPEQKELYRAFANRDVETVMQTRRKERKQIFVTGMSVRFVADVETAGFDATDLRSAASKKKKGEGFLDARAISELRMFGREPAKYDKEFYLRPGQKLGAAEETNPGFVVTITGYSPYKNLGELLEPVGVKDHRNKWGVVTRLIHLDDIVDGNNPFELYEKTEEKTELEHFKLDYKPIDLDGEMPPGIIGVGDTEVGESGEQVLIDPMTKEISSQVAKLDKRGKKRLDGSGNVVYEVNDQWFILNAKFIWKDAPKKSAAKTAAPITGSKSFGQKKGVSKRAKK